MFKCKYCGKEFETKEQLGGHIVWCKESPNRNGHSGFKKYDDVPEEDMGKKVIMRNCDKQGYTEFTLRKDGVYRCKKCGAEVRNIVAQDDDMDVIYKIVENYAKGVVK